MKHYIILPFSEFINENEFYQSELNPIFWKNDEFNPEIRTKLLQIANDFYSDIKAKIPIEDIQLTGSLANYNWTKNSDLDVHVIMDLSKINKDVDLVKVAMEGHKVSWNQRHPIEISGFDVELYAQDINQIHQASGLYSLLKGEWLRKPEFNPPVIDQKDIELKASAYIRAITEMIEELKIANRDDAKDIMERASVLKKKISKARDEKLLHKGGEFSIENLVFKKLRAEGWIGKLINIKSLAYSHMYSDPMNAADQQFSTGPDAITESIQTDGMVLVLGPEVEGKRRLFLFHIAWVKDDEKGKYIVHHVGLKETMMVIEDETGKLTVKRLNLSNTDFKKYTGLSYFEVILNSKSKTPYWHKTVNYTDPYVMLKELSSAIRSINGVSFK